MKRILAVLLVLGTLLSTFLLASCGNGSGKENPTETGSNDPLESVEDPNTRLDLPSDLKYNDKFSILSWKSWVNEFGEDEGDTGSVEQELYKRDIYIEDLLGLSFTYAFLDGNYEHRYNFANSVRNSVMGNMKAWDLIGAYSMVPPNLAQEKMVVDLQTLDYINFDKVWYPKFMTEACTVNEKTYFITGDISTNSLYAMQAVAFNSSTAAARGINEESLYQMVYDNEWTIENMLALCEDLGEEMGGEGAFYPIVTSNDACIDSFYFSSGLTMIDEDPEGNLTISEDVLDEQVLDIYSMLYDAKNTYKSYLNVADEMTIAKNKCIFSISPVINFRVYWNESQERFRILPFPKYNEQDPYRTYLSMWYTQYCVPSDIEDPDRSAAVIEAMGYTNYRWVTPIIFEETMKLRYSENADCSAMFDIMRNGRTYDLSSLFGIAFEGHGYSAYSLLRYSVVYNYTNWVSTYKSDFEGNLERVVGLLNTFYSK